MPMSYPAPPPASQPPSEQQPTSGGSRVQASGFLNDLFDIRFTRFVSLRLISVVYVVILIAVSLVALALVFTGFANGIGAGLFALVLAGLGWVIYVVLSRVALEAFAVLFRIHDDTSRVAEALGGAAPPAGGAVQGYDPPAGGGYSGGGYTAGGGGYTQGGTHPAPPQDPSNPPWV
jgi:ABC-type multidrug transport system permease subunit